uniref:Uncharacterized protein n=1 Tax=Bos indicus x Bos taurus TaxID=30522 RepID=A0A4W2I721_BOBOX
IMTFPKALNKEGNYSSACTCPKWPLQAPSLLELPEGTSPLSCRITASLSSNSQKRDICLYNLSVLAKPHRS